ncbi:MAG TPA: metallophosphoesterase family protein [Chloroflexota bacterium]|nr:metallophosphoesterase family protein [Chloroflexota bacterium]HUM68044.1 metallophosphoesterase family protein [Chloroflexota bacterium]
MRYAIITDIHANFGALQAVDNDVRRLRTQGNETIVYWFLGDLIGYGPDPVECIKWLKNSADIGERWLPGNHDEWLLSQTKVSDDAWMSLSKHQQILQEPKNRLYERWFKEEVQKAVNEEARSLGKVHGKGVDAYFVHASLQLSQRRMLYLHPWKKHLIGDIFGLLGREYHTQPTTVLFCGHTHYPMWFHDRQLQPLAYGKRLPLVDGIHIINPGSVGQPRDGDPRAAYLLFDPEARTVEFRRVVYEVTAVADRLLDNGYPQSLADRVQTADGKGDLQEFYTVYQRPQWDLDVVTKD